MPVKPSFKNQGSRARFFGGIAGIQTSDCIDIPARGRLRLTILNGNHEIRQGVDLKVNGGIYLADGSKVDVLRTWNNPRYEDIVEYNFVSSDRKLFVWNVYEIANATQGVKDVKWTDNAGFWIEEDGQHGRTYHCSAGPCNPPDFDFFVFAVKLLS